MGQCTEAWDTGPTRGPHHPFPFPWVHHRHLAVRLPYFLLLPSHSCPSSFSSFPLSSLWSSSGLGLGLGLGEGRLTAVRGPVRWRRFPWVSQHIWPRVWEQEGQGRSSWQLAKPQTYSKYYCRETLIAGCRLQVRVLGTNAQAGAFSESRWGVDRYWRREGKWVSHSSISKQWVSLGKWCPISGPQCPRLPKDGYILSCVTGPSISTR